MRQKQRPRPGSPQKNLPALLVHFRKESKIDLNLHSGPVQLAALIPAFLNEFSIGSTGRESAGSRVRAEEVQRLVGALKTKLGSTYDDLVNRETSFYGFDPDAPVDQAPRKLARNRASKDIHQRTAQQERHPLTATGKADSEP